VGDLQTEVGNLLLKGCVGVSRLALVNGWQFDSKTEWQYHLPSLIWFTVGYRRRDLLAKGCPPLTKITILWGTPNPVESGKFL
jgi:hypothetical protein